MRHFKKEILQNQIRLNGNLIRWESVNKSTGVWIFDEVKDAATIAELDRLADARKIGVVRISAEIYDSLKKKKLLPPSPNQRSALDQIRLVQQDQSLVKQRPLQTVVVAPAANQPQPQPPPAPRPSIPGTPPQPIVFQSKRGRLSNVEKAARAAAGGQ